MSIERNQSQLDGDSPPARVVVADDRPESLKGICALLEADGHLVVPASGGEEALALVSREIPDLLVTDVDMPDIDGVEVCRRLKSDPATRLLPVMVLTGHADRAARLAGIRAGADDFLEKPIRHAELTARVAALVRLKRYTDELDSAESMLLTLAATIEARDRCTGGHCQRMAAYAARLGVYLGLPEQQVTALNRGGYLHDVGKIAIPDAILMKEGRLDEEETAIMRTHPAVGESLCGRLRLFQLVRPIVRSHHERLDGSGYPDGLRGSAVPLLAQIMGVIDVYDALTTERPYRQALPRARAFEILVEEAERGWRDRALIDAFIAMEERSAGGEDASAAKTA